MTAVRAGDALTVTDDMGDRLSAVAVRLDVRYPVVLVVNGEHGVGVTLDDGLALLSFLADALGVERYVPPATCRAVWSAPDPSPCLLPPGHEGWHKALGCAWSGGAS